MQLLDNSTANTIYALMASEQKSKKKILHYTSTEVLDILLDKCTFRASNLFYLNDSMEYKAGIKRLQEKIKSKKGKEILKEIKDENGSGGINPGVFSISFSQETDSLYQWITYAKETGVAIELDDELIMDLKENLWYGIESYDETKDKNKKYSELLYIALRLAMNPVSYEFDNKTSMRIDEMESDIKEKYMWYSSFFKKDGFKAENEIRLSVFATKNDKVHGEVKYFPMGGKGILRPYLNITFGYRKKNCKKQLFHPCLPLKSIMVGPSGNQQVAFNSIVHRIKYGKSNIYEYAKSKNSLLKAFENYFEEVIEWMNEREYLIDGTICTVYRTSKGNLIDDFADKIASKEFAKNKVLSYDKLGTGSKGEIPIIDLITQIISDWVDYNKDYLSEIKMDSGKKLYYKNYLKVKGKDTKLDNIVKEIYDNFYLSKEGVLIKKSKIPYIF